LPPNRTPFPREYSAADLKLGHYQPFTRVVPLIRFDVE
jgi:hypothetical protein